MTDLVLWESPWRALRVTGPDRKSWLNGIVTCNAEAAGEERSLWGTLLTKQGKVQADLHLFEKGEELFVVVAGAERDQVCEALDGYLVMEDAELRESELRWLVAIEGAAVLQPDSERGVSVLFSAMGQEARLIGLTADELVRLQRDEANAFLTEEEWTRRRVAAGFPQWGVEYDSADNLHAAGLERRTVDWTKGCYLGQEVVCMQEMRGKVRRRLVLLGAEGQDLPTDAEVLNEAGPVGRIVSVGEGSAFARVEEPHYAPGTELTVNLPDGASALVTVRQPG